MVQRRCGIIGCMHKLLLLEVVMNPIGCYRTKKGPDTIDTLYFISDGPTNAVPLYNKLLFTINPSISMKF